MGVLKKKTDKKIKKEIRPADTSHEVEEGREYKLILSIVQRGYSDEVVDAARAEGGTGAVIIQGKGTNNEKRKFFGFNIEPENELVMMVVEADLAVPITKAIYKAVDYKSEARGLVFVLPVSYVSGMTHSKGFFDEQAMGEMKYHYPDENPEDDIEGNLGLDQ